MYLLFFLLKETSWLGEKLTRHEGWRICKVGRVHGGEETCRFSVSQHWIWMWGMTAPCPHRVEVSRQKLVCRMTLHKRPGQGWMVHWDKGRYSIRQERPKYQNSHVWGNDWPMNPKAALTVNTNAETWRYVKLGSHVSFNSSSKKFAFGDQRILSPSSLLRTGIQTPGGE